MLDFLHCVKRHARFLLRIKFICQFCSIPLPDHSVIPLNAEAEFNIMVDNHGRMEMVDLNCLVNLLFVQIIKLFFSLHLSKVILK